MMVHLNDRGHEPSVGESLAMHDQGSRFRQSLECLRSRGYGIRSVCFETKLEARPVYEAAGCLSLIIFAPPASMLVSSCNDWQSSRILHEPSKLSSAMTWHDRLHFELGAEYEVSHMRRAAQCSANNLLLGMRSISRVLRHAHSDHSFSIARPNNLLCRSELLLL